MNTEEVKRLADFIDAGSPLFNTPIDYEDCETIAKAILSSGLVLPLSSVVGTLQWEEGGTEVKYWFANGGNVLCYNIYLDENKSYDLFYPYTEDSTNYLSLDEAKKAAQSHYSALINSCLVGGGYTEEQMIERLKDILMWWESVDATNWRISKDDPAYTYFEESVTFYLSTLKQQP